MKKIRTIQYVVLIVIILFCSFQSRGQASRIVQQLHKINDSVYVIKIKWYTDQLLLPQGVNIYRRESPSSTWSGLNELPVRPLLLQPNLPEIADTINYSLALAIRENPELLKEGILLLNLMVRSFESEEFAALLGILYIDTVAITDIPCQYEIRQVKTQREMFLCRSDWIKKEGNGRNNIEGFDVKQKGKTIGLKWTPDDSSFYGVNIYRKAFNEECYIKLNAHPLLISLAEDEKHKFHYPETFYADTNLCSDRNYNYYLAGLDFFGKESFVSDTASLHFADSIPPGIARDFNLSKSGSKVLLGWTPPVDSDLIGFRILRSYHSSKNFTCIHHGILRKDEHHYTDSLVQPGPYYYKIQSIDSAYNFTETQVLYTEIHDLIAPEAPSGLSASSDTNKVVLCWNNNCETDILGYLIYRSISGQQDSNMLLMRSEPISDTFFIDKVSSRIKNTLAYRIVAVDSAFNRSARSSLCIIRMKDIEPPAQPVITGYHSSAPGISISWMQNYEPDLAYYRIIRQSEKGELLSFSVSNHLLTYIDSIAEPGKEYEYSVTATDSSGNESEPSVSCRVKSSGMRIADVNPRIRVSVSRKKHAVKFSLELPKDSLCMGYAIYKGNSEGTLERITRLTRQTEYTDTKISRDSAYVYEFRFISQGNKEYTPQKFHIDPKR